MKGRLMSNEKFWSLLEDIVDLKNGFNSKSIASEFNINEEIVISSMNILIEHDFAFQTLEVDEYICVQQGSGHGDISFLEVVRLIALKESLEDSGELLGAKLLASILKKSEEKIVSFTQAINRLELRYTSIFSESNIIHLGVKKESLIHRIEKSILDKKAINLIDKELNQYTVLPLRIVHIDGSLSCVAENIDETELSHWEINSIDSIEELELNFKSLHSKIEVDDYLVGLRSLSENEVRLILKIGNEVEINQPNYLYFANPILIRKSDGYQIWAASVEPNEEVFEWLCSLGSKVEIIDPSAFKRMFLRYCENKLNLISA